MKILEVVGLTCRADTGRLIAALSFTVEEGEIVALCGSAGAGKTACLRGLCGALPAHAGRLIFDGREVTGLRPRELAREGLALAGEMPTPLWSRTVGEAVAFALRWPRLGPLAAVPAKWRDVRTRTRVEALLDRVGLAGETRSRRQGLPAAARWRLELAQALALRPRLLLLDEPLGRLAPAEQASSAGLVSAIRVAGTTVVLTERDPTTAKIIADRVAVLDQGTVIA
jgi:branched-chain amino acid transport system ATP-binding protein